MRPTITIKDAKIIEFLLSKEQPYWTVYKYYDKKCYMLTFQYELIHVTTHDLKGLTPVKIEKKS